MPTNYQPTTFLERGASVPFTAPTLDGARVRPAPRAGVDLVLQNPAGGRGAYIVPLTGLRDVCRPTLHDIRLIERIAALPSVTPALIRTAAKQVAREGYAGRAAGAAATATLAADAESRIVTNFNLLLRLVEQEEPGGAQTLPPLADNPAGLERWARRTMAAIAPRLRQDAQSIATALEELAVLYDPLGIGNRINRARLPHAIARLRLMRQEVEAFPGFMDEQAPALLALVARTADLTLGCADRTLAESRAAADRVFTLLTAWFADRGSVINQVARTEWLMDGWERIYNLWWLDTRPAAQREALDEIVRLLPIIPREAGNWVGYQVDFATPLRLHRLVLGHEDWRTGRCVQDSIARNEKLLAA